MTGRTMKTKATKAVSAGGVTGAATFVVLLVLHAAGAITLSQDAFVTGAIALGGALGMGITAAASAWLPRNEPKP